MDRGQLADIGGGIERGGWFARPDQKLGRIVSRRPAGITANQWNAASRTGFDFVVWNAERETPAFAVEFADPSGSTGQAQRLDRMKHAVCEAVGLELLRVESPTLRPAGSGRRIVEYLIDARAFLEAGANLPVAADPTAEEPLSYRDIVGRLPDGRSGHVNDLGAVARAAAVDAYVNREVADPIVRSLQLAWKNGPAEGWAWLQVRDGRFIFERVALVRHRFSCGVEPARLAEDFATMAVGERLRNRDGAGPALRDRAELGRELDGLRRRRDELENPYASDHISFD